MKPLIAFDTSTPEGSVAVGRAGRVLASRQIGSSVRHAESLLPAVAEVLGAAELEPVELGGVVVAAGPGSFTGVRVAAATARGLVRALDLPLFAFGSLLAAAAATRRVDAPVCAVFDARRGEVYAACYRFGENGWDTLLDPTVLDVEGLLLRVAPHAPLFAGQPEVLGPETRAARPVETRAEALLRLTQLDEAAGRVDVPGRWEPQYLRPSGAERMAR